ncbi:MAG: FHA domain-containing protein [Acaryochloridaceae cyanobacterium RU_4_10]|nr:FHA domain-containing protein [Acaryochloridaceae cyanobacterium RU_4_10]
MRGNPVQDNQSSCQERHVLVINDGKRRAIALEAAAYSVGRDASNAIVLNVDTISRQHAMLLRLPVPGTKQYRYRIVDGNTQGKPSANGVFINGTPCRSQEIENGDIVRFGHTVEASYLTVSMGDAEFASYLESISYQSLKSDTINAKETMVGAALSEADLLSVMTLQSSTVTSRDRTTVAPWAETVPESKLTVSEARPTLTKASHPYRLWMIVVPSVLVVGAAIAGIWMASQGRPAQSSANESGKPAMVESSTR